MRTRKTNAFFLVFVFCIFWGPCFCVLHFPIALNSWHPALAPHLPKNSQPSPVLEVRTPIGIAIWRKIQQNTCSKSDETCQRKRKEKHLQGHASEDLKDQDSRRKFSVLPLKTPLCDIQHPRGTGTCMCLV